ncbi:hypothetical protein FIBSPDRAFT_861752 [Athelia psychrophila]|uniref:Uncharacterized protein n=1 Tax=Athelia psychrophila TaxID=1759441 RepID=A0A166J397_9AGAM|nr:hypothetical protein FIBSPDRAFT_861752 [Fibularhizoctonia sp. CBS 109695]
MHLNRSAQHESETTFNRTHQLPSLRQLIQSRSLFPIASADAMPSACPTSSATFQRRMRPARIPCIEVRRSYACASPQVAKLRTS